MWGKQTNWRGEVGVWPPRDDTDFPSATITADSEDLLNILLDKHGGVFCPTTTPRPRMNAGEPRLNVGWLGGESLQKGNRSARVGA